MSFFQTSASVESAGRALHASLLEEARLVVATLANAARGEEVDALLSLGDAVPVASIASLVSALGLAV